MDIIHDCRDAPRAVKTLDAVLSKVHDRKLKSQINKMAITEIVQPILPAAARPVPDSPGFNQQFNSQLGFEVSNIRGNNSDSDLEMQDTFLGITGTDLSNPTDFNWVGFLLFLKEAADVLRIGCLGSVYDDSKSTGECGSRFSTSRAVRLKHIHRSYTRTYPHRQTAEISGFSATTQ